MKFKPVIWAMAMALAIGIGCASGGDEGSRTEVEGMVVSDSVGDQDWDREYTDDEVQAFAAAYTEVTSIQQDYQRRMADVDEAQRQQLSQESAARSEEAMGEHGISPDQYNAIAIRLPDDEDLRQRVAQAVQQMESERREETQRTMDEE